MILVTGGAAFVSANFALERCAANDAPVVNLDKPTCAGNLGCMKLLAGGEPRGA